MLWRWSGKPSASSQAPFKDVNSKLSGFRAVQWGAEAGVVKGFKDSNGVQTFVPDNDCTRAQIVTFLFRYAREIMGLNVG